MFLQERLSAFFYYTKNKAFLQEQKGAFLYILQSTDRIPSIPSRSRISVGSISKFNIDSDRAAYVKSFYDIFSCVVQAKYVLDFGYNKEAPSSALNGRGGKY